MPVSDKHKIVFIHIPKNAGTSAAAYFEMENLGHFHWTHYCDFTEHKKVAIVRNPWDRFVSCYEYAKMERSYYHSADGDAIHGKHPDYETLKDKSFEECVELALASKLGFKYNIHKNGLMHHIVRPQFLKHQGWIPQCYWICDKDRVMVDHLIKQENISHPEVGLPSVLDTGQPVPETNPSTRNKNYRDYYNEETKEAVASIYEQDIRNFEYEF